jgi:hypothetical protein
VIFQSRDPQRHGIGAGKKEREHDVTNDVTVMMDLTKLNEKHPGKKSETRIYHHKYMKRLIMKL